MAVRYNELRHKTAALVLFLVHGDYTTVPVDSHVFRGSKNLAWTDATTEEECSLQLSAWLEPGQYIAVNDTMGSIGQLVQKNEKTVRRVARELGRPHVLLLNTICQGTKNKSIR
jgi:endonuclease III